jgi:hypothetical protein
MKPFGFSIIIAYIILGLINCSDKNRTIADNYNPIDTLGSYKAKNLNGLSHFIIGVSTYSKTLSDLKKEWKTAKKEIGNTGVMTNAYYYTDWSSIGMGEDSYSGLVEIKWDTIKKYESEYDLLHDDIELCKDVKRIKMIDYYVGNVDIRNLCLTFFKDTLYKITCYQNDDIDSAFIIKYGKGKYVDKTKWLKNGRVIINPDQTFIDKNRSPNFNIIEIYEQRIWENDQIKAESMTNIHYVKSNANSYVHDFYIISKDTIIESELKRCRDLGYAKLKEKTQREKRENLNEL